MALTSAQRQKRKQSMRRAKAKIIAGRKKAAKRTANKETLMKRARKQAMVMLKNKLAGGKKYSELPFAARQSIDDRVKKKGSVIDRLAKKILPVLRKKEMSRKKA